MRRSGLLLLLALSSSALALRQPPAAPDAPPFSASNTSWVVVWTGGQSNSIGTNSQPPGEYPTWPTTPLIQSFCWSGKRCTKGTFAPAAVPLFGESNVGFSQTYANLLLQTLPPGTGVILLNTGVGGTGFREGNWVAPSGPLAVQSVAAVKALWDAFPTALGGSNLTLHSMLWHQGEDDAGDNRGPPGARPGKAGEGAAPFQADYCTYLVNDLSNLIDFFRASFPTASPATPFIDGGLLPYWEDAVNGTEGVVEAIYALNTSRACTATADSRIFRDFTPLGAPNGDPEFRSGASGDVIHFTATQAFFLGQEYYNALLRAKAVTAPVGSARTVACPGSVVQPAVAACA